MTRGQTGNQHMAEPGKDTWANRKPTHERTRKGYVDKQETATWHNRERTRGRTRKGHMDKLETDTWQI
jgi:hypothetical protein